LKEAPVSELRSEKTGLKKFYTRPEVRVIAVFLFLQCFSRSLPAVSFMFV